MGAEDKHDDERIIEREMLDGMVGAEARAAGVGSDQRRRSPLIHLHASPCPLLPPPPTPHHHYPKNMPFLLWYVLFFFMVCLPFSSPLLPGEG